jgi:MFS family permease
MAAGLARKSVMPAGPSAGWMAAMALAQLGLWLGLYAPLKILLPLLADLSAGHAAALSKEALLAAATLVGSLVALVANPLAGALSDRTRGRWGPRHPWILAGTLLAAAAIAALPLAGSPLLLVCGWGMAKLGLNAAMAGLNGSAADRVPPAQQGGLWGWIGMAQPLGLVLGVMASTALLPNLPLAAAVMGLLLLATALPFLGTRALPLQRSPARSSSRQPARQSLRQRLAQALAAFRHPPFAALWWSRFWLYLGWSASTVYLLYFLEDRLGLPRPQALQAQALLLLLYTAATAVAAAWAGQASDRLGQRLVFVWAGSGAMGVACALMLISQALPMALAGSTLLGLGYGVYVATHQALVVEHLPDPQHHARDLGLFNGANTAPMVLAPALAWLCVTQLGGYSSLFLVCSLLILASNLTLLSSDQFASRYQHGGD